MSDQKPSRTKILWILPPIIIGVIAFMFLKGGKQEPGLSNAGEPVRSVRSITVDAVEFTPVARGFGTVQPARVWKAVSQVSGRVTIIHPRLSDGAIIEQGETLLEIDRVDYELALAQAKITLSELDVQQSNSEQSLAIEQRNLALAEKEFERQKRLRKQGTVSQSAVDTAERTMLNSRTQVQSLENTLALLPSQKKLQQSRITQAQRDLDNTRIEAPFNLRVSGLDIQADQFISKGQHLFSGDSINHVEIVAQISVSSLKNLFAGQSNVDLNINSIAGGLAELTGFKPTVMMDIGNTEAARWDARFVRFTDKVDSETRTLGLVVAVDDPMKKVIPGKRPPLSKGMLVEVSVAGKPQPDRLVIPRSTIRNGMVYLIDQDNRLKISPIHLLYEQDSQAIVDQGIRPGDRLVLSDVIPAVEGIRLRTVETDNPVTGNGG